MNAFGGQFLDAPMRWVPELGYLLKSDAKRKEALQDDLDANSICSQQIKKVPLAARRKWLLCFISFDNGWLDLPRFSGEALAHLPACFRIELGW